MAKLILPIHSNRRGQSIQARLVNCYAEQSAALAKAPITLFGCPGVKALGTLATTPYRGSEIFKNELYAVGGGTLYKIDSLGATTSIGTIEGKQQVTMAENRDALSIYTSGADYTYDGVTLAAITDPDKRASKLVDVISGYVVAVESGSDRFFTSELGKSTSFVATDFGTAAAEPDLLISLLVDKSRVILFGSITLEMWFVIGGSGFPLGQVPNGVAEIGCIAEFSPIKLADGVFFVDQDRIPRRLLGLQLAKISSHAIDQEFRQISNPTRIFGFSYTTEGHQFYCLTTDRGTFIYDVATGEWHERKSLGLTRWRIDDVTSAYNMQIAFDSESGQFGTIDETLNTEFGDAIRMEWAYPTVWAEGRIARHRRLEISATVGKAAASDSPVMGLEISDDGGETFVDVGSTRSLGKTGEYFEAPIWTKLGSSRNRIYRPYISDAVRRVIADTQLEVDGGRL